MKPSGLKGHIIYNTIIALLLMLSIAMLSTICYGVKSHTIISKKSSAACVLASESLVNSVSTRTLLPRSIFSVRDETLALVLLRATTTFVY